MNNEEYPRTFTEQIESADNNETSPVLGVVMGENRYLIPMTEVNEVIPIPKLAHVPLNEPWFFGLISVRGNFYGITNLVVYFGGHPMPFNLKSRLLEASPGDKMYAGFIVNSMRDEKFLHIAPNESVTVSSK